MSRKKYNAKLELLQELYESLEEIREQLDMALGEVEMSFLEEKDFTTLFLNPYDTLLSDLQTFVTDTSNGVYDEQENSSDFEEE
jgi:hypothetical protein